MVDPINITQLTKRYDSILAVNQLSFTAKPGRVTGFLGPNGAGKTTTLRILVGLITPSSGSATFGSDAYIDLEVPQRVVGCALEAAAHPGRSGRDHLNVLAATAMANNRRVNQMLSLVGLTAVAERRIATYSLGMRQRLALAGALVGDPEYLILDEPSNGLDPEGIRWLRGLLRGMAAEGRVVLVSSHLLAEMQETVDDIVVIAAGKSLLQSEIGDLDLAETSVRVRVTNPERAAKILVRSGLVATLGVDDEGQYVRVVTPAAAHVGSLLFESGMAVHELVRERYNLEDQFFSLLQKQAG